MVQPVFLSLSAQSKAVSRLSTRNKAYYIRQIVSRNHEVKKACVCHRRRVEVIGMVSIHFPVVTDVENLAV